MDLPLWIVNNSNLLKNTEFIEKLPKTLDINSYEDLKNILNIIKYFVSSQANATRDIPYPVEVFSFFLDEDKSKSIIFLEKLKNDLSGFEETFYDKLIKFLNEKDKFRYALEEKGVDNLSLFKLLHKKEYIYLTSIENESQTYKKWNKETCAYAAKNGQLECLKYAKENGCPCPLASSRREG
jgi:hypothetical protein